MTAVVASMMYPQLRASWDTSPSPKLTTPSPPRPPKPQRLSTQSSTLELSTTVAPAATTVIASRPKKEDFPAAQLWSSGTSRTKNGDQPDELYLGCDIWLPVAPKVKKPRSIYNAASLAYLGDCIYELYARRHFLYPPLSIDVYNERVMSIVRCEAQDALLTKLMADDYLTEEERDILRWGKNIGSSKTRTRKRAGVAVYSRASSLETLIGWLYLTNMKRLEGLMYRLGFSTGASSEKIVEKKT